MLEHGGRLRAAATRYAVPGVRGPADWLDLSTGINPHGYPVPVLDSECWRRLPDDDDDLAAVAAVYYGSERLLAVPGAQAAIQLLPALFQPLAVTCLTPIYAEHPQAWERAGHKVRRLQRPTLARALAAATPVIVLGHPNNPDARRFDAGDLLDAAAQLRRRGGWLIVDEAFGDDQPENCVTALAGGPQAPNLIALRSLGKFFGLAGARVGFVFGASDKLSLLREALGPWPLSGPARAVARRALADAAWQERMRRELAVLSARLQALLAPCGELAHCALFVSLQTPRSAALYEHLAAHAILTRHFPAEHLLRLGLPGSEAEWQRLAAALASWQG